jgi:hypothetical protein
MLKLIAILIRLLDEPQGRGMYSPQGFKRYRR